MSQLPLNGRCPLEDELAATCGVSRTTVRKAYDLLERKGIIRKDGPSRFLAKKVKAAGIADNPVPVSKEKAVSEYLVGLIAEGKIVPGQRISESNIAEALGCSMSPVREALISLSRLGILKKKDRKQWQAVSPDSRQFEELIEFRKIIEKYCLEQLMRGENLDEYLPAFKSLLKKTKDLLKEKKLDMRHLFEADVSLHQLLLDSRKNQLLLERTEFVYAIIEFQLRNRLFSAERALFGLNQHINILKAIVAGDQKAALRELDSHLTSALESLKSIGEGKKT